MNKMKLEFSMDMKDKRVLIVDDVPSNIDLLKKHFS